MTHTAVRMLIAALVIATGTAQAQQRSADERITPPGGQVDPPGTTDPGLTSQISDSETARGSVDQIQARRPRAAAAGQVTSEPASTSGSPQLGRADRSTQGAGAVSRRSDGRPTGSAALGGTDRCDPATPRASTAVPCDRVIETRSAEFARPPAPMLSPEQRLLLDRDRMDPGGVRSAVDRVGRNDIDSNASETQALASITLGQPPADTTPDPTADGAPGESAVDAIIQIINAAQAAGPR